MHYTIIVGSHRPESQSSKVGHYIKNELNTLPETADVDIIDLRNNPLPLWHDCMRSQEPKDLYEERINVRDPMAKILSKTDALVVIAPERGGMVPAGLKNFFTYCGPDLIGNKPGLIVTVSGGIGGSYPVAELRMSSYKNTQICYIPQHVIVRNVVDVLNDDKIDEEKNHRDASIKHRITYSLKMLEQYAKSLKGVRNSGVADRKKYAYGM